MSTVENGAPSPLTPYRPPTIDEMLASFLDEPDDWGQCDALWPKDTDALSGHLLSEMGRDRRSTPEQRDQRWNPDYVDGVLGRFIVHLLREVADLRAQLEEMRTSVALIRAGEGLEPPAQH